MATAARKPSTAAPATPATKAKFKVSFNRMRDVTDRAAKTIEAESYTKDSEWVTFTVDGAPVFEASLYAVASIERLPVDA